MVKEFEHVTEYSMSLHKLYATLGDGNTATVDDLYQEATDLAFVAWNRLPPLISRPHVKWLQEFHKLIELKESKKLLESMYNMEVFKSISTAWRERLPNLWEHITVWSDILQ